VLGWGEEDGKKFWICQNSYGPGWGENGYFKVRRGADDLGIESNPTAYNPELLI